MKIIIEYFVCFVFCFLCCDVSSQNIKKHNELQLLEITNTDFCQILDSVISFELKCDYYRDSLFFVIDVKQSESRDTSLIQIESLDDMSIAQKLDPSGYVYYNNHLFIVFDKSLDNIFAKTTKTKKFKYLDYDPYYHGDNENIILNVLDDSFTIWVFAYINDIFIFESKSGSCVNSN